MVEICKIYKNETYKTLNTHEYSKVTGNKYSQGTNLILRDPFLHIYFYHQYIQSTTGTFDSSNSYLFLIENNYYNGFLKACVILCC